MIETNIGYFRQEHDRLRDANPLTTQQEPNPFYASDELREDAEAWKNEALWLADMLKIVMDANKMLREKLSNNA